MRTGADIDPSNLEAAKGWDGPSGAAWVTHAEQHDRAVSRYLEPLLAAAALQPDHRVLDVGCGNGLRRPASRTSSSSAPTCRSPTWAASTG